MSLTIPYSVRPNGMGLNDRVPLLSARLSRNQVGFDVTALVDSGATFNVLPFDVGQRFGIPWNSLPQDIYVGGSSGHVSAKGLLIETTIAQFPPMQFLYAWASTNAYPVIFGQANFFFEFDVCFFRKRGVFQIAPATP